MISKAREAGFRSCVPCFLNGGIDVVLFVNACVRGEKSRTLELCREYVAGLKRGGAVVREANLEQMHLVPLSAQKVAFRSQLARAAVYEDSIFELAHQFAEADDIIIGAPYWDLSFPAALKTYVEHVSVDGITFRFTPDAHYVGLCRARRITYITTSGSLLTCGNAELDANSSAAGATDADAASAAGAAGVVDAADVASAAGCDVFHPAVGYNLGYDYICAIARMFGIPDVRYVAAEGLDIVGININDQMECARKRIEQLLEKDVAVAQG